jgi:arsenate reductase
MKKVLFVCTHNAGRSQMAEAFFNKMVGGRAKGTSAGTQPSDKINPLVVAAMQEVGIDIRHKRPKKLTLEMMEDVDLVITMGCGAEGVCPASFVLTEDWQISDPEGKPMEQVRRIRDEVKTRVEKLIKELSVGTNFT